jgi:hypothetical protein
MKRINVCLFLILQVNLLLTFNPCLSQNKTHRYSINIQTGIAGPMSKTTFYKYWSSPINISLSGLKQVHNHLYAGLEIDYCKFRIDDWLWLDSRLNLFNPNISTNYRISLFKKLIFVPEFSIGYSWIIFSNSVTPAKYLKPFNEAGFSFKSGLTIGYQFKNGISMGITSSYNEIFKRFGVDNSNLYENRKEANNVSYLCLNVHLGFII